MQEFEADEEREFHRELERLEALFSTANNKPAIELQIANTYGAGGQSLEALRRLHKLVAANLGFDPSRDSDLAKLQGTTEFKSIMEEVRRQTPPVHNSRLIATLNKRDVRPESIAFDNGRNTFFLGNTARFEVVRCSIRGDCDTFASSDHAQESYVLGVKIDSGRRAIWVTDNATFAASLRCYDLGTGKLQRIASLEGKHIFNDLAISSTGTVYVSDTAEGSVYRVPFGTTTLQRVAPQHTFTAANGIAISADETLLYVSTWEDGIDVIDLQSGVVKPLIHPDHICLAFTDGLSATRRGLIAIQNGPMLPRIIELRLGENQLQVIAMRVLERRNPAFDGITTGVVVRNDFYYVANPQTDKKSGAELNRLKIFSVRVHP